MAAAHRVLLSLFSLGVVVQFFLAGLGVFRHSGDSWGPHRTLGNVLLVVALLVLVAALAGRLGRGHVLLGLVLAALVLLQSVLANDGPAWVRAFHPVVALVIAALAGSFTGRLWRQHRAGLS